jgi:hypothetical protein
MSPDLNLYAVANGSRTVVMKQKREVQSQLWKTLASDHGSEVIIYFNKDVLTFFAHCGS